MLEAERRHPRALLLGAAIALFVPCKVRAASVGPYEASWGGESCASRGFDLVQDEAECWRLFAKQKGVNPDGNPLSWTDSWSQGVGFPAGCHMVYADIAVSVMWLNAPVANQVVDYDTIPTLMAFNIYKVRYWCDDPSVPTLPTYDLGPFLAPDDAASCLALGHQDVLTSPDCKNKADDAHRAVTWGGLQSIADQPGGCWYFYFEGTADVPMLIYNPPQDGQPTFGESLAGMAANARYGFFCHGYAPPAAPPPSPGLPPAPRRMMDGNRRLPCPVPRISSMPRCGSVLNLRSIIKTRRVFLW